MALNYDLQLANAGKFEASLAPGTTTTDGGAVIATILLKCGRPLVRAEVANSDAAKAATLTWQYQCHDNATWTAIPAANGNQPATLAAATTTQLLLNVEGMYAIRLRAYLASGGTGTIAWRGSTSDKSPSSNVVNNSTFDLGNVNLLDSEGGSVISPATTGLQKLILVSQGIMPVQMGFGVKTIDAGANTITLHASTACKYAYLSMPTGGSVAYYRPNGVAAESAAHPNHPLDATMLGRGIVLATPATTLVVWGVVASSVAWVSGNDA